MVSSSSSSRRQANLSEESQESSATSMSSSSVESVIDSTVRGRLGFPSPLPPHRPLRDEEVETSMPDNTQNEILLKVGQLMDHRRLTFRTMIFLSRQASAQTSWRCPTVWVDAPVPNDDSWYILLRDIRDYLSKAIPQTVAVEIIDMSLFAPPTHFPVEESHPIVPIWDRLVRDFIRDLNCPLWTSISGIRRGQERANSPVTIVITSKCPSQIQQYETRIIQTIRENGLSGIEVAFLEVEDLFSNGNDTTALGRTPPPISYATSKALYMGASVGVKDDPICSGTIGGHIILTYGSKKYDLGVTNCHVVSLEKPGQDVSSIHPYDRTSARTVLVSPSDFDHQFWNELFCKNLEAAEGHLESFTLKYGTEKLDDRRQVAFRKLQGRISMYKKQLKLYNTLVRAIGPVFSRSGFEMRGGRASDWALFYLPSDRLFDNELPSVEDLVQAGVEEHQLALPFSGHIEEVGDMILGSLVFKIGRTNGLSSGTVHSLKSSLQIRPNVVTSAFLVTGLGLSERSAKGDSGSWIVDKNGRWVGLFFAAPGISLSGDAFALPAGDMIKDIELVTGGKVTLP